MKKIFLLTIIGTILSSISGYAQFSSPNAVTASKLGIKLSGMDEVFFYYGASSYDITYTATTASNFTWSEYTTNPSTASFMQSNNNTPTTTLPISQVSGGGRGYVLDINGSKKYIWLIELRNTALSNISSLLASDGSDPCNSTQLDVVLTNPELYYYNSSGVKKTIPRTYTLTYNTLEWGGSAYTSKQESVSKTFSSGTGISQSFTVDAPLANTTFTLSGDQILSAFNQTKTLATQSEYTAVAVAEHIAGTVAERTSLNEKDRTSGTIGGSAPLVVDFSSNANTPTALYYRWSIINLSNTSDVVYYTDKDLHYTFKSSGSYKVKLEVSNATCTVVDSITPVKVVESALDVPNVFTPNGDGKNDEFRVAYKSLISFHAIVFNRWGRKVYEWSDPGRGWDGKIGGKVAAPGAYYYMIDAEGSDGIKYKKKGDINLIRSK
jgi:gliding motility-associated-like protein